MKHQKVTSLMAIDISAAFDVVNHIILLSMLEKTFSVHDRCLAWFESYLKPMYCMMNIRDAFIKKGVSLFSTPGKSKWT